MRWGVVWVGLLLVFTTLSCEQEREPSTPFTRSQLSEGIVARVGGTPIDRSEYPSFGQIVRDQRNPDGDVAETEAMLQKEYRDRLY